MTHPHGSTGERDQLGPSGDGTVMLDIGPGRGALIVHASAAMVGVELEIARTNPGDARSHMAVRKRVGPRGDRYAAIFPSLPVGEYVVYSPDGAAGPVVTVTSGTIAELAWPPANV